MGPGQGVVLGGLLGQGEGGNLEPRVLHEGVQLDALVERRGRRHLVCKGQLLGFGIIYTGTCQQL